MPRVDQQKTSAVPEPELSLPGHAGSELLFVYFCSGPRRGGDLSEAIEQQALAGGLIVVALAHDPVIDSSHDMLKEKALV